MPETTREDTRTKRRAILDAATELFARQGYENTTIADIAQAAGVAVGTVYLYFRNKHEIYASVSIDWVESIARVLQDPAILALPAIDAFLQQAIAQGQLVLFDTQMYAKILFGMVHSVLYECYCIEHGENEELYRERTIEVIERLFFGPSLSEGITSSGK